MKSRHCRLCLPAALCAIVSLCFASPSTVAQPADQANSQVRQVSECVEPIISPPPSPATPSIEHSLPWQNTWADTTHETNNQPGMLADSHHGDTQPLTITTDHTEAHKFATGKNIRVAVIDTGVFDHHQLTVEPIADLVHPTANTPMEDCDGHGTLVAGIIAARDTGIAPHSTILAIRQTSQHFAETAHNSASDEDDPQELTSGTLGSLAEAIHTAVDHDADLINISVVSCLEPEVADQINDSVLDDALARAEEHGAVIVAAAGNIGQDCDSNSVVLPSSAPSVISVGAMATARDLAEYSLPHVDATDVAAPGHLGIGLSPSSHEWASGVLHNGQPAAFQGTSFATPVVTGAIALLRQRHPDLSPAEIRERVNSAAYPGHNVIDPLTLISHFLPNESSGDNNHQEISAVSTANKSETTFRSWSALAMSAFLVAMMISGIGWYRSRQHRAPDGS